MRSDVYHQDSHISYYGADNKLRVFNRHIGIGPASADSLYGERGVFEEYRYDALGRRVLERTRRIGAGCPGTLDCQSRATRTVWDGDRILYEIRSPGGEIINNPPDSTPDSTMVSLGTEAAPWRVERWSGPSSDHELAWSNLKAPRSAADTTVDPGIEGEATVIGYTHALGVSGIDEPVEIRANGLSIFPHTGWRGMLAMGTYDNGAQSDCSVANPCERIDWPASEVTIDRGNYGRTEPTTWYGSLASAGTEGSGLQYMRNRYYDPKRGQFTQADPIGLGGGLNLYGFAGSDPMSYSDPLGLCPFCGPLALAASGAAEEAVPGIGQVIGTATIAAAGAWALGKAIEGLVTAVSTASSSARERNSGPTVRLQAQGGGLEESVIVQAGGSGQITAVDALHGLARLRASLSPAEANVRAAAFLRAERFIAAAALGGGYMGPGKSFPAGGNMRVDVEVIRPKHPVFILGPRSDAVIQHGG